MLDKQINYPLILPDKIRVLSSSLFSSWLNDGIFRLDMEANKAISRIERVFAAIVEEVVVLRQMLDIKRWLVIVFRGFKCH
jgi:hypothetical protein